MKQFLGFISILLFFSSCDYINLKKSKEIKKSLNPIAKIYGSKLYLEDISEFFPKTTSKKDSIIFSKSLIDTWAIKKLLLKKAVENSSLNENKSIDELVQKYRESLLINNYKERLIKQQLDTIVSVKEIIVFYEANKQNFRLNEELVQLKYLQFDEDKVDKKKIINLFKSDKLEDVEMLEQQQFNFKQYHLNDSIWLTLDNVLLKIPYSKEKLLKKTKFSQKVNSLGLYLVAVKNILKRNEIAPLSYVSSNIKQMILHKRKLELIREIEKIILQDAVQNKNFKIY